MTLAGSTDVELSQDGSALTVRMPLALRRRGGRKIVISPSGADNDRWAPRRPRPDNNLVITLARAFRWQGMLESGKFATVSEIAAAEKLDRSYVSHVLRLTLLAPDLVEAILDGSHPATLQLQSLVRGFPLGWEEQRKSIDLGGPDLRRTALHPR